jgi:hypothetical protein
MAMGHRRKQQQPDFWIPTADLPQSPGHPFYERLNKVLPTAGFDHVCEQSCRKFYHARLGRPSVPPGVYFRVLLVGYFEKLPSERHAVDLDTSAIVAPAVHAASGGDTTTMWETLEQACNSLQEVREDETAQADT